MWPRWQSNNATSPTWREPFPMSSHRYRFPPPPTSFFSQPPSVRLPLSFVHDSSLHNLSARTDSSLYTDQTCGHNLPIQLPESSCYQQFLAQSFTPQPQNTHCVSNSVKVFDMESAVSIPCDPLLNFTPPLLSQTRSAPLASTSTLLPPPVESRPCISHSGPSLPVPHAASLSLCASSSDTCSGDERRSLQFEDRQRWLDQWSAAHSLSERVRQHSLKQRRRFCPLGVSAEHRVDTPSEAVLRRSLSRRRRTHARKAAKRRGRREALQRLHMDIDECRRQTVQKASELAQEKQKKFEADKVFREISRKVEDVNRQIQLVEGLSTLRRIRSMKARQRTHCVDSESAERTFSQRCAELLSKLRSQLSLYKQQQQRCRDQQHVVTGELSANAVQKRTSSQTESVEEWACLTLFGESISSMFNLNYQQRQQNPTSAPSCAGYFASLFHWPDDPRDLLKIRTGWDKYLSADSDPLGSSVPISWYTPVPPSSEEWRAYMVKG